MVLWGRWSEEWRVLLVGEEEELVGEKAGVACGVWVWIWEDIREKCKKIADNLRIFGCFSCGLLFNRLLSLYN